MQTMLITGGRVIDPATGRDESADVAIRDGRVAAIGPRLDPASADRVIDADGLIVCPGLIDPHVHLREPGFEDKETVATGARAAAAGGFTTVCCMPNTRPALDSPEMARVVLDLARSARCRVFPVAAATIGRRGEQAAEIGLLARAGAVGISDDGDAVASAGMMRSVLRACAEAGLAFMQHCQEPTLTRGAAMHAGPTALRLGLAGWPRSAEEIIIERDVRLLRDTGGRYHVQHISSAGSVEIVRDARAQGLAVTAEASPHHLLLTDEACNGYDTNAKMNPPLREHRDVEALRAGVAQGVITVLATDHAPHTADEKALPFDQAPFGIVGLETAVAAYAAALVDPGLIGWPRLIALMTAEPARLCNLDVLGRGIDALGTLRVGGPADVTIIDPDQAWTVGLDDFAGRSRNSPFIGTRFTVRPVATIVAGRVVHEYSPARA